MSQRVVFSETKDTMQQTKGATTEVNIKQVKNITEKRTDIVDDAHYEEGEMYFSESKIGKCLPLKHQTIEKFFEIYCKQCL